MHYLVYSYNCSFQIKTHSQAAKINCHKSKGETSPISAQELLLCLLRFELILYQGHRSREAEGNAFNKLIHFNSASQIPNKHPLSLLSFKCNILKYKL